MHPELAKFKARMPPRSGLVSVFQYGLSLFFAYLAAVPPEHQLVLAALAYLTGIGMIIGAASGYSHAVLTQQGADALLKQFRPMAAGITLLVTGASLLLPWITAWWVVVLAPFVTLASTIAVGSLVINISQQKHVAALSGMLGALLATMAVSQMLSR